MDPHIKYYYTVVKKHSIYRIPKSRNGVYSTAFSKDGKTIVCGYGDGGIELISSDGALKFNLKNGHEIMLPVTCIRWLAQDENKFLYTSASGSVTIGDAKLCTNTIAIREPDNELYTIDLVNNGTHFVTAGKDLPFKMYDLKNLREIRTFSFSKECSASQLEVLGHVKRVFCVRRDPLHPSVFVSGGWDNNVIIWDVNCKNAVVKSIYGPHIAGDGLDIHNNVLLTCSWAISDAMQTWDLRKYQKLMTYECRTGRNGQGVYLYAGRLANNDMAVSGGSGGSTFHIFKTSSEKPVNEIAFNEPLYTCDTAQSGKLMVYGGASTSLHILEMMMERPS